MSDTLERFQRTVSDFRGTLSQVGSDQWHNATPCTEWDLRQLVNHVTGELAWMPPLVEGQTIAEIGSQFEGDLLGDDPGSAYARAADGAVAAVSAPGALGSQVHLSYGDDTTQSYADQVALDCLIHRWDLARAFGADDRLPADLVQWGLEYVTPMRELLAASGMYAPEVQVSNDAGAQTRLLALLGREG